MLYVFLIYFLADKLRFRSARNRPNQTNFLFPDKGVGYNHGQTIIIVLSLQGHYKLTMQMKACSCLFNVDVNYPERCNFIQTVSVRHLANVAPNTNILEVMPCLKNPKCRLSVVSLLKYSSDLSVCINYAQVGLPGSCTVIVVGKPTSYSVDSADPGPCCKHIISLLLVYCEKTNFTRKEARV